MLSYEIWAEFCTLWNFAKNFTAKYCQNGFRNTKICVSLMLAWEPAVHRLSSVSAFLKGRLEFSSWILVQTNSCLSLQTTSHLQCIHQLVALCPGVLISKLVDVNINQVRKATTDCFLFKFTFQLIPTHYSSISILPYYCIMKLMSRWHRYEPISSGQEVMKHAIVPSQVINLNTFALRGLLKIWSKITNRKRELLSTSTSSLSSLSSLPSLSSLSSSSSWFALLTNRQSQQKLEFSLDPFFCRLIQKIDLSWNWSQSIKRNRGGTRLSEASPNWARAWAEPELFSFGHWAYYEPRARQLSEDEKTSFFKTKF